MSALFGRMRGRKTMSNVTPKPSRAPTTNNQTTTEIPVVYEPALEEYEPLEEVVVSDRLGCSDIFFISALLFAFIFLVAVAVTDGGPRRFDFDCDDDWSDRRHWRDWDDNEWDKRREEKKDCKDYFKDLPRKWHHKEPTFHCEDKEDIRKFYKKWLKGDEKLPFDTEKADSIDHYDAVLVGSDPSTVGRLVSEMKKVPGRYLWIIERTENNIEGDDNEVYPIDDQYSNPPFAFEQFYGAGFAGPMSPGRTGYASIYKSGMTLDDFSIEELREAISYDPESELGLSFERGIQEEFSKEQKRRIKAFTEAGKKGGQCQWECLLDSNGKKEFLASSEKKEECPNIKKPLRKVTALKNAVLSTVSSAMGGSTFGLLPTLPFFGVSMEGLHPSSKYFSDLLEGDVMDPHNFPPDFSVNSKMPGVLFESEGEADENGESKKEGRFSVHAKSNVLSISILENRTIVSHILYMHENMMKVATSPRFIFAMEIHKLYRFLVQSGIGPHEDVSKAKSSVAQKIIPELGSNIGTPLSLQLLVRLNPTNNGSLQTTKTYKTRGLLPRKNEIVSSSFDRLPVDSRLVSQSCLNLTASLRVKGPGSTSSAPNIWVDIEAPYSHIPNAKSQTVALLGSMGGNPNETYANVYLTLANPAFRYKLSYKGAGKLEFLLDSGYSAAGKKEDSGGVKAFSKKERSSLAFMIGLGYEVLAAMDDLGYVSSLGSDLLYPVTWQELSGLAQNSSSLGDETKKILKETIFTTARPWGELKGGAALKEVISLRDCSMHRLGNVHVISSASIPSRMTNRSNGLFGRILASYCIKNALRGD